jgi:Tfp pilus assembly pilus retraction ATPase PilT
VFTSLIDSIEKENLLNQLLEIEDPSKVIFTLTKGILNQLEVAQNGHFVDFQSWDHIKKQLNKSSQVIQKMKLFERVAR